MDASRRRHAWRWVLGPLLLVVSGARADYPDLRQQARVILDAHCGKCHNRDSPKPSAKALRVFDLAQVEWPATISDRQLPKVMGRMAGTDAPETERQRVADFIEAERQHRGAAAR